MEYRLPKYEDYEILKEYVIEHYSNMEQEISSSIFLTGMDFKDWVDKINRNYSVPDPVWGKSNLYLVFDENRLVGLVNIRYEIGEDLANKYGHIGYGVRPSERKKGYATKMLKYALDISREKGLSEVILACHEHNFGSNKVIQKNGGVLYKTDTEDIKISDSWTITLNNNFYKIKL